MGTTVTTNLSLIKPDLDESIKEDLPTFAGWAAQNEINCDKIDALFRFTTHSYSPTWTAATTNPTLGAGGSVTGKYIRLFPKMVIGQFQINTGGAGFAAGSGSYRISVPVAVDPDILSFTSEFPCGKACFFDSSSALDSSAFEVCYATTVDFLFLKLPINNQWNDTTPVALGQNDKVSGYFMYPTRAA